MADKKDKKGTSSISGVGGSKKTTGIDMTQGVGDVDQVKGIQQVGKVSGAGGISDGTGSKKVSFAERERILHMVEDEAKEFFKGTGLSKEKQEVIQRAVKMAIDTGLVDEEGVDDKDNG